MTHWSCFNGADETFACAALAGAGAERGDGGSKFTGPSPCIARTTASSPAFWNGTLLAFNGSKSSSDFGVLQIDGLDRDKRELPYACVLGGDA